MTARAQHAAVSGQRESPHRMNRSAPGRERRWVGLAGLVVLAALQAVVWNASLPQEGARSHFAWRATALFVLQILSVFVAWKRRDRAALLIVITGALLFRWGAYSWPPELSDDLYRYVWDGRVQQAGISPYAAAPSDVSLKALRDQEVWPHINRPDAVTVYPPGTQLAFLSLASVGGSSIRGVKIAAGLLEILALALIGWSLRRRERPLGQLLLYAWSPLVIAEVYTSGHTDTLLLPIIVIVGLSLERSSFRTAGVWIGVASLIKLFPLVLLATLPRGARLRGGAAAIATLVVGYLPYAMWSGIDVVGFLPSYVGVAEDFNISARAIFEFLLDAWVPHTRAVSMAICGLVLTGLLMLRLYRSEFHRDAFASLRDVILIYLVIVPTAMHPWYALWLVPVLAIRPSLAGVWLVGMLPLSYLKYDAPEQLMPPWVWWVEWMPVLLLGTAALWVAARRTDGARA